MSATTKPKPTRVAIACGASIKADTSTATAAQECRILADLRISPGRQYSRFRAELPLAGGTSRWRWNEGRPSTFVHFAQRVVHFLHQMTFVQGRCRADGQGSVSTQRRSLSWKACSRSSVRSVSMAATAHW
jgi:hypothetical protein